MRLVGEDTRTLNEVNELGVHVAAKSGTAQQTKNRPNHALLVGFAPYEQPEIAIATRIANGYTSANAAEIASMVLKYYYHLEDEEVLLSGAANQTTNETIID